MRYISGCCENTQVISMSQIERDASLLVSSAIMLYPYIKIDLSSGIVSTVVCSTWTRVIEVVVKLVRVIRVKHAVVVKVKFFWVRLVASHSHVVTWLLDTCTCVGSLIIAIDGRLLVQSGSLLDELLDGFFKTGYVLEQGLCPLLSLSSKLSRITNTHLPTSWLIATTHDDSRFRLCSC